jgi:hypothetical protein
MEILDNELIYSENVIKNIQMIPNELRNIINIQMKKYINDKKEQILGIQNKYDYIFKNKLSLMIYLLFTKMHYTYSEKKYKIINKEKSDIHRYDDKNRKCSLSYVSLTQIYKSRNLYDIEKYVDWLCCTLRFNIPDIIYITIFLKRIIDSDDAEMLEAFKNNYDILIIVIFILEKKLSSDRVVKNSYYSKLLNMELEKINKLELIFIFKLKLHVTEEEYLKNY